MANTFSPRENPESRKMVVIVLVIVSVKKWLDNFGGAKFYHPHATDNGK